MKTLVPVVLSLISIVTATHAQVQRIEKKQRTTVAAPVIMQPVPENRAKTYKERPQVIYPTNVNTSPTKSINTGSEPAFNKVNKGNFPDENASGTTCTVSKVVFTSESTTFMNGVF